MELKRKTAPVRKRFAPRSDNPTISILDLRINPKTIKKRLRSSVLGRA